MSNQNANSNGSEIPQTVVNWWMRRNRMIGNDERRQNPWFRRITEEVQRFRPELVGQIGHQLTNAGNWKNFNEGLKTEQCS